MTAGERAVQLWDLLRAAIASGDQISREHAMEVLGFTDQEFDAALEVVKQAVDNTVVAFQKEQSAAATWVPFAERTASKEIRRLIAYG